MEACPNCFEPLHRLHPTALERLFLSRVFYCAECRRKRRVVHDRVRQFTARLFWLLRIYSSCIRCGSDAVRRVPRYRSSSRRPSIVLTIEQALQLPTYRCLRCDASYADVRPACSIAQPGQGGSGGSRRVEACPGGLRVNEALSRD